MSAKIGKKSSKGISSMWQFSPGPFHFILTLFINTMSGENAQLVFLAFWCFIKKKKKKKDNEKAAKTFDALNVY